MTCDPRSFDVADGVDIVLAAFEGLSLEDLKPHVSALERRRDAALARNEPRKSPKKTVEDCEPLELKPHICGIEQRKMDSTLVEKYMTPREQQKGSAGEDGSNSAVQWQQHVHPEDDVQEDVEENEDEEEAEEVQEHEQEEQEQE